ncbi:MAG: immune inhibitor A [Anaerolineales bacterium]|nr:immune inhibitor A [Anaerolineales bacterium]
MKTSLGLTSFIPCGIILVLVLVLVCCVCLLGGIGAWTYLFWSDGPVVQVTFSGYLPGFPTAGATPTPPVVIRPTATLPLAPLPSASPPDFATPQPTEDASAVVATPFVSESALDLLNNTIVPVNDPLELAVRLERKSDLPHRWEGVPVIYQIGDVQDFWVTNTDSNLSSLIQATLRYETSHVYFWIENGVAYDQRHLQKLVEAFEDKIYPTNREFFGSEWTPGVDNDPHLFILYARELGSSVAGYFSSVDQYLPAVRKDSNGHEMFLLSANNLGLDEDYTYGVLAHEFQHMIHWYRDRNEETWMNEGFSNLAVLLNGYSVGGSDYSYILDTDMQLTDWPASIEDASPNYGSSFLFVTYFLDRFGEEATKAVIAHPANGMTSLDLVLAELGLTDRQSGKSITADDVFADWAVTNLIQDSRVADGRFTYHNYPNAPQASESENISTCPLKNSPREVSQYGVDYIRIDCRGDFNLHFEGSIQVKVLPADAYSGSYAFYSNLGDESDMTLTRQFDFSQHSGPLTLKYWTWYDLEQDYDYVYLLASEDGEKWDFLITPSGTGEDPSGNSFGWGYNGLSGRQPQWIEEEVDISQYAGKVVQLRFEYITDAAVNGEGFLVDDIAIPETGYYTDFESGEDGWQAEGFVRIQNILPQTFRLTLITRGDQTTVQTIELTSDNAADIPLSIGEDVDEVFLVVSGVTRFTRQKATYQFSIQPR